MSKTLDRLAVLLDFKKHTQLDSLNIFIELKLAFLNRQNKLQFVKTGLQKIIFNYFELTFINNFEV